MLEFVAGWVGGVSLLACGHPFDTVKVRLQGSAFDYRKVTYRNSVDCAVHIYRTDGMRGFYRGITSPILIVGVANGAQFFTYLKLLEYFSSFHDGDSSLAENMQDSSHLSLLEKMMCAAAGGCAQAFVMAPFEMVRIRLQTVDMFPHRKYFGAVDCARTIYREGGVRKLYRGLSSTFLRDAPGAVVYFGSYGLLRQMLPNDQNKMNYASTMFAGGCAGVAQWMIVFPLDTIKTRRQIAKCGQYIDWVHVARDLWKTEGLAGFYFGIAPSLCRAFFANAACFCGVEFTIWVVINAAQRGLATPFTTTK